MIASALIGAALIEMVLRCAAPTEMIQLTSRSSPPQSAPGQEPLPTAPKRGEIASPTRMTDATAAVGAGVLPESRRLGSETIDGFAAGSPDWPQRRGELSSPILARRESLFRPPQVHEAMREQHATEAERTRRLVLSRTLEMQIATRKRMGPAPWEQSRFQAFAALLNDKCVIERGNDFAITASPQDSLRWYQEHMGVVPSEEARQSAIALLRTYERSRKVAQSRIAQRVRLLCVDDNRVLDAGAFSILDGSLHLVAASHLPRLADALREFESEYREAVISLLEVAK